MSSPRCARDVDDDGLTFLPDTIRVERIRDDEAYEGVRVRVEARLGVVRVPLQMTFRSRRRDCSSTEEIGISDSP